LIESSFQGLSVVFEAVRIVKELMEIWLNEVCDTLDAQSWTQALCLSSRVVAVTTATDTL